MRKSAPLLVIALSLGLAGVASVPARALDRILPDYKQNLFTMAPCERGFELSVTVAPVNADDSRETGMLLQYRKETQKGLGLRVHTGERGGFGRAECLLWQKRTARVFERMLLENARADRARVSCRNVASIKYRVGVDRRELELCLADSRRDGMTFGFQTFYQSTDLLVAR